MKRTCRIDVNNRKRSSRVQNVRNSSAVRWTRDIVDGNPFRRKPVDSNGACQLKHTFPKGILESTGIQYTRASAISKFQNPDNVNFVYAKRKLTARRLLEDLYYTHLLFIYIYIIRTLCATKKGYKGSLKLSDFQKQKFYDIINYSRFKLYMYKDQYENMALHT